MKYSPWQRLRCKREDEASKWPNTHIEEINMQNLTSHSLRRTLGFGNKRPRKGGLVVFGKQRQPRSLSNLLRIYGDNLWLFLMITKDTRHLTRTTFRTHPLFKFNSQPHGKQKLPVFSLRNPNPITVKHTNLLRGNERKRGRERDMELRTKVSIRWRRWLVFVESSEQQVFVCWCFSKRLYRNALLERFSFWNANVKRRLHLFVIS